MTDGIFSSDGMVEELSRILGISIEEFIEISERTMDLVKNGVSRTELMEALKPYDPASFVKGFTVCSIIAGMREIRNRGDLVKDVISQIKGEIGDGKQVIAVRLGPDGTPEIIDPDTYFNQQELKITLKNTDPLWPASATEYPGIGLASEG